MGVWTPQGVLMWPFAVKRIRKEQSQPAPCPAVSTCLDGCFPETVNPIAAWEINVAERTGRKGFD